MWRICYDCVGNGSDDGNKSDGPGELGADADFFLKRYGLRVFISHVWSKWEREEKFMAMLRYLSLPPAFQRVEGEHDSEGPLGRRLYRPWRTMYGGCEACVYFTRYEAPPEPSARVLAYFPRMLKLLDLEALSTAGPEQIGTAVENDDDADGELRSVVRWRSRRRAVRGG